MLALAKNPDERDPVQPHACVHEHRRIPMRDGDRFYQFKFKPWEMPALGGPCTPSNHSTCPLNDITYPPIRLLGAPEAHPLGQDFLWTGCGLWRPRYRGLADSDQDDEVHGSYVDYDDPLHSSMPRVVFLQPLSRNGLHSRPITPFPVELVVPDRRDRFPWLDLERHTHFNWNGLPRFNVLPCSDAVSDRLRDRRRTTDETRAAAGLNQREDEDLWKRLEWEEDHGLQR
eukprot:GHVU01111530.1.p1 GENE.GHVU01111530.1~~GHVU01111530.1.p1  ORF type:complete len:229 (+),score=5.59 GHVU01111530.1:907-1593(+)